VCVPYTCMCEREREGERECGVCVQERDCACAVYMHVPHARISREEHLQCKHVCVLKREECECACAVCMYV